MKWTTSFLLAALLFAPIARASDAQPWLKFDKMVSIKSLGTLADDGEIRIYLKNKRLFFGFCPQTGCENMGAPDGYDPVTIYERAEKLEKLRGSFFSFNRAWVAGMAGLDTEFRLMSLAQPGSFGTLMLTHACSLAVVGSSLYHQYREAKCYRTFAEAFGELRSGEAKILRFGLKVPLKVMREQLTALLQPQ